MRKSKANGNQKANNVVMDLCRGTKIAFNPLRIIYTDEVAEEIVQSIDYGEFNKQSNDEEGSEDTMIRSRETEHENWFLAGIIFGKRQSDRSISKAVKLIKGQG